MKFLLAIGATTLLVACGGTEQAAAPAASPKPTFGTFGIDLAAMDTSVKPGDDFYRYVNGKWVSSFTMPADKARYGVFDALRDKSETDVHTLLEEFATRPPAAGSVRSEERRVGKECRSRWWLRQYNKRTDKKRVMIDR